MIEINTVGNVVYYLIDKVVVAYATINDPYNIAINSTTSML